MSYCTNSQQPFSANEVWKIDEGDDTQLVFSHTAIVATEGDQAYHGTSPAQLKDIDKAAVLKDLSPIPQEDIYPQFPSRLTRAPEVYIKVPGLHLYTPEKKDVIARRLLHEAEIYETLRQHPHPNLGQSLGCVVNRDGLITGLVLLKYKTTLFERAHDPSSFGLDQREQCVAAIKSALEHLHGLGLAHNDLSPLNVMFTEMGNPVLLDFDTCHPIGTKLEKGGCVGEWEGIPAMTFKESSVEHDEKALGYLSKWLQNKYKEMDLLESK